jgi:hypothetical protein
MNADETAGSIIVHTVPEVKFMMQGARNSEFCRQSAARARREDCLVVSTGTYGHEKTRGVLEGGLVPRVVQWNPRVLRGHSTTTYSSTAAFLIRPFLTFCYYYSTTVVPLFSRPTAREQRSIMSLELIMSENREYRTTEQPRPRESTHTYFVSDYCTYSLGTVTS